MFFIVSGVVAASAGNHALALAYHGAELGIPVTVLMPSIAPLTKITKCRALGANVILEGDSIADAAIAAQKFVTEQGMKYINGFDDFNIIAGAGSVGLEILEDAPNIDAIIIPVGGGGLIAGISLAVKTINPDVQIIGVEPSRCASSTYRAFSKSGDTLFAHTRLTLFLSQKQWPPRWKPGKSSRL